MSKSRKVEKNELIKIVKDISRKMEDFSDSVQKLQDLKENLDEVDDLLAEKETVNRVRLDQLNRDFQDNKIKAVTNAAAELGRVLITREELDDLKKNLDKIKTENQARFDEFVVNTEKTYNDKLQQTLDIQKLQHECETAELRANVEVHKKDCINLKEALKRMSDELESQKQLTAEIAGMNRPKEIQRNT